MSRLRVNSKGLWAVKLCQIRSLLNCSLVKLITFCCQFFTIICEFVVHRKLLLFCPRPPTNDIPIGRDHSIHCFQFPKCFILESATEVYLLPLQFTDMHHLEYLKKKICFSLVSEHWFLERNYINLQALHQPNQPQFVSSLVSKIMTFYRKFLQNNLISLCFCLLLL